ncbi:MAG: FN3 domain-containing metallophosphoesterase family protein [Cyclobacteriaceae bacterium]
MNLLHKLSRGYCLALLSSLFIISILDTQAQELQINHGPYLQYVTTTEATVVWTTNKNSISWVEFYEEDGSNFYAKERPKAFASEDGLKTIGKIHKVTLEGLKPTTKYAYRVYSHEVVAHKQRNSLLGETTATRVYKSRPLYFSTLDPDQESTSFVLLTDVHEQPDKVGALLEDTDFESTDFVIMDGDFMNDFNEEKNLFEGSIDTLTQIFAKELPLYIVRGNHETRGVMGHLLKDYFHFPDGKYYYTFSYGDTFFIVLDSGEDKADSDIEYSGLVDFDAYRTKEAEWLNRVVNSEQYRKARHRIVFSHIPPYGGGQWHGDIEMQNKFVPILNKAGIDLMICGHTHRYSFVEANPGRNEFPILICSNTAKANVQVTPEKITVTTVDMNKKVLSTLVFDK